MGSNISVGQKLYHFAYGPLTVTKVSHEERGDYVDTVADFPRGYRGGHKVGAAKQTWILDTIGHWLFESPDQVGTENNDFDWKKLWTDAKQAPILPVADAKDRKNWHTYYSSDSSKNDSDHASAVGVSGNKGASAVGVSSKKSDGASAVGVTQ